MSHRPTHPLNRRWTTWAAALALVAVGPALASEPDPWSVDLEPMRLRTFGHDQHVLTITRRDTDATPARRQDLAVALNSGDGSAFGGRIERQGED